MRIYYDSLKRLYKSGRATKDMLLRAVVLNKITEEEYKEIINK